MNSASSPVVRFKMAAPAFTLVELLTVVAVIGLLAALALPAYRRVVSRMDGAECMNNMRQIGAVMSLYAGDHNGRTPITGTSPWYQENTWGYELWPYAYGSYSNFTYYGNCLTFQGNNPSSWRKNIFRCWSTRKKVTPIPPVSNPATGYSYGFNSDVGASAIPNAGNYYRNVQIPLLNVPNQSRVAMVTETSQAAGDYNGYYKQVGLMPHDKGTNILFYDGHVEWRKFEDIPSLATDLFWDGN